MVSVRTYSYVVRFCNYRAQSIQTRKSTELPIVLVSNPFHCTEEFLLTNSGKLNTAILSVYAISLATTGTFTALKTGFLPNNM
jgi:hypothetical protein